MEVWKDVKGYEGYYKVSNLGRVKSVQRIDSLGRIKHGIILTGCDNGHGYLSIQLAKNGCKKRKYIHRLVAEAFIDCVEGRDEINHKDEDRSNNRADNLEWCDSKYNCNYGSHNEKLSIAKGHEFMVINNLTGETFIFNSKDDAASVLHVGYDKIVKGLLYGRVSYSLREHIQDLSFKLI